MGDLAETVPGMEYFKKLLGKVNLLLISCTASPPFPSSVFAGGQTSS